jgi:hypothetical protein
MEDLNQRIEKRRKELAIEQEKLLEVEIVKNKHISQYETESTRKYLNHIPGNIPRYFPVLLISVGALIMLISLAMDVSVSTRIGRVSNVHLISQQQILMMFGGFVFIGGVILYGIARINKTSSLSQRGRGTPNKDKSNKERNSRLDKNFEQWKGVLWKVVNQCA